MLRNIFLIISLKVICGLPVDMIVKSVAESNSFDDFDNYIPRYDDLPNFNISHSLKEADKVKSSTLQEKLDFPSEKPITTSPMIVPSTHNISALIDLNDGKMDLHDKESVRENDSHKDDSMDSKRYEINKHVLNEKVPITDIISTFNISGIDNSINETTRNTREETEKDDPEFAEKESQESNDEEEEEDMNMVTGILSALLGGLSKPDGSIDLEAIVGLIGSLSAQNDDGTYDFSGLTELLKGFFGGGADGGSDIGSFAGGLIGAIIKGIANPPGGKGVGILTAKLLAGILPAISVQPPDPNTMEGKPAVKPGGLDIGGLLYGFLKTLLGASKGGDVNPVQFVISTISSFSNSKPEQKPKARMTNFSASK